MQIDRLIERIKQTQNLTVVGLDPRLDMIPARIKEKYYEQHGKTPQAAAAAFYHFNKSLIDALYDIIPAVKPQIAMYEQYGAPGIDCYIKTIEYAKSKGLTVIGDIKRSDIASTAEAYSDGHIGMIDIDGEQHEIYKEDFSTLNPYLGSDSIAPYLSNCQKYGKGLFILVKTSNPNSGEIQDLQLDTNHQPAEPILYQQVGKLVSKWGEDLIGKYGYSSIGAVAGATHPSQIKLLRSLMPHTFFLIPGYGAQGGTADDLAPCFDKNGIGAIVNSSRGIIAAYKSKQYQGQGFNEESFAEAARQAALDMKTDLGRCVKC